MQASRFWPVALALLVLAWAVGSFPGDERQAQPWPALLVGAGCLLTPLAGWWRQPGPLTGLLCLAGAGVGIAFMGYPGFTAGWAGMAVTSLRHALVLAGVGATVRFALEWARPGRRVPWVMLPPAAYWLVLDWRLLAPGATGLVPVAALAGGILLAVAGACVLVTLLRAWIRARRGGVPAAAGLLLGCTLAGLAPLAVAMVALRWPGLPWPPPDDCLWALLLLPPAWTRAALAEQARRNATPDAAGTSGQVKNML